MKKYWLCFTGIILSVFAANCFSGAFWELVTIEKISSDSVGKILIRLDKKSTSLCDNQRVLAIPRTNGKMHPLLFHALFAYTTGDKINIYGAGECQGEFEIVSAITNLH